MGWLVMGRQKDEGITIEVGGEVVRVRVAAIHGKRVRLAVHVSDTDAPIMRDELIMQGGRGER